MEFVAAGFDPNAFGALTLRQVQLWIEGATRRDMMQMAQTARAVWAGAQLTADGVDAFVRAALGEEKPALPPEQAVFGLLSTTATIPTVRWEDVRSAT